MVTTAGWQHYVDMRHEGYRVGITADLMSWAVDMLRATC